jgi:ketosteroid isomerase-like protein
MAKTWVGARGRFNGSQTGYRFVHCWTVRDGVYTDFDEYVDPDPELLER